MIYNNIQKKENRKKDIKTPSPNPAWQRREKYNTRFSSPHAENIDTEPALTAYPARGH